MAGVGRIARAFGDAELVAKLAEQATPPASALSLPPIPDGYVRLTHVMPERSRQILSGGEPFIYRKHGLDGTTDAYSNNEAIEHLAATGDPMFDPDRPGPSAYTRNPFGNHMALIDLPAEAHKRIALNKVGFSEPIPNAAILGFVDRDAMTFAPNQKYNLDAVSAYGQSAVDQIRSLIGEQSRRSMASIPDGPPPGPPPMLTGHAEDVW